MTIFKNPVTVFATVAFFAACAPVVPKELADARAAYQYASLGAASQVAPAELHKARQSLAEAEKAFEDDPEGQTVRDLGYIAQRKAQLAEALAAQELENRKKAQADKEYQKQQAQIQQRTQSQLSQTREQLAETERMRKNQIAQLGDQLKQEQRARVDAETKAAENERKNKELLESLSKLAAVKEEERGMVITLSGSVLFAYDQSTLLPEAQMRLNQVADALLSGTERDVLIEGHTDARGNDGYNLALSQRRADAVRNFLVSRGFAAERVRAMGIGESRPVAENRTAEGRANNRRVEIILQAPSER